MAPPKLMTPNVFFTNVAESAKVKVKDAKMVFRVLPTLLAKEMRANPNHSIQVPGVARLKLRKTPARKATTKLVFGKSIHLKPKPQSEKAVAYAAKCLKDAVSSH